MTHDHGHSHSHEPADFGRAFLIGVSLNTLFIVIEAIYGLISNSTALLADAGHNLSDVLGLLIAWGAATLSRRAPSPRFTYGLRSSSLLAALFNATFLLIAVGAIAWEAVQRFADPKPVAGAIVMVVAGIGIVINGVTAALFAAGRKRDINIEGAFLHLAGDAAVSFGVMLAALVYIYTGWTWVDPAASLAICAVIVWSTWSLLKKSVRMSLSGVPDSIDPAAVRSFLLNRPGVKELHDLHIWPISTMDTALSCHLVMPDGHPGDGFLMDVAHDLGHRFAINHVTMQIEVSENNACALAPDSVV
ncbi:cation diffusion facilitator family transporter [Bradyrhizobium sp. LHD-71]|uniref:cation diffusion facilitator family transporter n=1 Tax=Bradyrhizobium sp. LHD-71 TaxID=3072141 RepID=UPI00280DEE9F|nr:cation diffusion facilitator family transporter [Bradyrhizobium sp. LHD-71]MDQ8726651.1 cation diffusion facilitator family transporter [Bradyrhizobium sp. LHD-71]